MTDIITALSYIPVNKDMEPALLIMRKDGHGRQISAITLRNAWRYNDGKELMRRCFRIAEQLDMYPDRFLIHRIADAILNWLPDLIKMPPYQPLRKANKDIGLLKLVAGGETQREFAVMTDGSLQS